MIRAYISPFHNDWHAHLPALTFAYNSSLHASTGFTPFFLNYGHNPLSPFDLLLPNTIKCAPSAQEFVKVIKANLSHAKDSLRQAQARQSEAYNRKHTQGEFKVDDMVLLSAGHLNTHPTLSESSVRKFSPKYYGPFKVTQVISPVAYKLAFPASFARVHPVIHISRLKAYNAPEPARARPAPPPPDIVDGQSHYHVSAFLGVRGTAPKRQFLVKFSDEPKPIWRPETALRSDMPDAFHTLVKAVEDSRGAQPVKAAQRRKP